MHKQRCVPYSLTYGFIFSVYRLKLTTYILAMEARNYNQSGRRGRQKSGKVQSAVGQKSLCGHDHAGEEKEGIRFNRGVMRGPVERGVD